MTKKEKKEKSEKKVDVQAVVNEQKEKDHNPLLEGVRKLLLAGIGAVSLAQEEMEDFINKLVERGEIAEKDGRKLLDDVAEKRKKKTRRIKQKLDQRLDDFMVRRDIPTRTDVDALNAKIAELTKKIDALKKE